MARGELAYAVAGEAGAPPVLLVHGVYAGASSFEFRRNFEALSRDFRVYAIDLLGCGASERPERGYGPDDVAEQVEGFARDVIGARTHLVASSLSAALIVPVAVRSPRLFGRLVLICPTGFGSLDRPSGRLGDAIHASFRAPVIGDGLYNAIVSKAGIRYYLGRIAYHDGGLVDEDLVWDYYRTGHQPGAKHLAAAFVSGKLNFGLKGLWSRVPQKTLLAWGQEARTTPLRQAEVFTRGNPRAELRVFRDAALLPHDERAEAFNEEVRRFLLGGKAAKAGQVGA
ncbi:alpha/beta fold hydrolase [Rubrobacter marinus]|uniref:alpha/beta fold hydrolase n=1 Tax=Rubrobacter marinus TaxID=2653852 RepID=UPI001409E5EE|nr:alpha/beta fold hydrolase [Rubrobacter marinus]